MFALERNVFAMEKQLKEVEKRTHAFVQAAQVFASCAVSLSESICALYEPGNDGMAPSQLHSECARVISRDYVSQMTQSLNEGILNSVAGYTKALPPLKKSLKEYRDMTSDRDKIRNKVADRAAGKVATDFANMAQYKSKLEKSERDWEIKHLQVITTLSGFWNGRLAWFDGMNLCFMRNHVKFYSNSTFSLHALLRYLKGYHPPVAASAPSSSASAVQTGQYPGPAAPSLGQQGNSFGTGLSDGMYMPSPMEGTIGSMGMAKRMDKTQLANDNPFQSVNYGTSVPEEGLTYHEARGASEVRDTSSFILKYSASIRSASLAPIPHQRQQTAQMIRIGLSDYIAASADELSVQKGGTIEVLETFADGWALGRAMGVTGFFPLNFTSAVSGGKAPPLPPKRKA